jgi:hypothetical protein
MCAVYKFINQLVLCFICVLIIYLIYVLMYNVFIYKYNYIFLI